MILLCLVLVLINQGSANYRSLRDEVTQDIIDRSSVDSLPMVGDHPVQVSITFQLFNIKNLNHKDNLADISFLVIIRWKDPNLSWNYPPSPASQIKQVVVPTNAIWTPKMKEFKIERVPDLYAEENVVVFSDGSVFLDIEVTTTVSCDLSGLAYRNTASCSLEVESWYHPSTEVVLCCSKDLSLDFYSENSRYQVLNITQTASQQKYPCCPDPFDKLKLNFNFIRK